MKTLALLMSLVTLNAIAGTVEGTGVVNNDSTLQMEQSFSLSKAKALEDASSKLGIYIEGNKTVVQRNDGKQSFTKVNVINPGLLKIISMKQSLEDGKCITQITAEYDDVINKLTEQQLESDAYLNSKINDLKSTQQQLSGNVPKITTPVSVKDDLTSQVSRINQNRTSTSLTLSDLNQDAKESLKYKQINSFENVIDILSNSSIELTNPQTTTNGKLTSILYDINWSVDNVQLTQILNVLQNSGSSDSYNYDSGNGIISFIPRDKTLFDNNNPFNLLFQQPKMVSENNYIIDNFPFTFSNKHVIIIKVKGTTQHMVTGLSSYINSMIQSNQDVLKVQFKK